MDSKGRLKALDVGVEIGQEISARAYLLIFVEVISIN